MIEKTEANQTDDENLHNFYIQVSPTLPLVIDMDFAIAKVSTKGQIVIPLALRAGIKEGDEFLIVKDKDRFVLKNMKGLASELKDELKFIQRIDAAWDEYEKGKFIRKSKEDFLKELKKW